MFGLRNSGFVGAAGNSGPTLVPTEGIVTRTTTGVSGVAESFNVSGGNDEAVTFGNGDLSGDATFDSGGSVTGQNPPSGWSYFNNTSNIDFTAPSPGAVADFSKTSGGGGSVTTTVQGVTAVAEVNDLDFGGATSGYVKLSGSSSIAFDANAATVAAAIAATLAMGTDPIVTGSAGSFTVTASDDGATPLTGARDALVVTENALYID